MFFAASVIVRLENIPYHCSMEPSPLKKSLRLLLHSKLMGEREEELWGKLIDHMNDEQLTDLWRLFEEEIQKFKDSLSSLPNYLSHIQEAQQGRLHFLQKLQKEPNLSKEVSALLVPEKQFSEKELDEAFKREENGILEFLVNLSVVQLEYCKEVFRAMHEEGKIPEADHAALQDFLMKVQEGVFEREKEAAQAMRHITEAVSQAIELNAQVEQLKQIQASFS